MSSLSLFTFLLIALCCYASSSSKTLHNEYQEMTKVNIPHSANTKSHTPEHNKFTNAASTLKDETRQKRSQRNDYADLMGGNNRNVVRNFMPEDKQFRNLPEPLYNILMRNIFAIIESAKDSQTTSSTSYRPSPRTGRSSNYQLLDDIIGSTDDSYDDVNMVIDEINNKQWQLTPRVIKKSVPFKPRLGKRTQQMYE